MSLFVDTTGALRPDVLRDPSSVYAQIRRAGVVFDDGLGAWAVGRHADVRDLIQDSRLSSARTDAYFSGLPLETQARFDLFRKTREGMAIFRDAPDHRRLRGPIAEGLRYTTTAQGRGIIAACARRAVAALPTDATFDVVTQLAAPLPLAVLLGVLGIPERRTEEVARLTATFNLAIGGLIRADLVADAQVALERLLLIVHELVRVPRPGPAMTPLLTAHRGGLMNEQELMASVILLLTAGHETTSNLLANAVRRLADHPSLCQILTTRRELLGPFLDEVLRLDPSVHLTTRQARQEVDLGHEMIPAGDRVVVFWAAANRDTKVFESAAEFRMGRSDASRALSFGAGPHFCPGRSLAREKALTTLGVLLDRFNRFELAAPPVEKANLSFRGLAVLEVVARAR